METCYGVKLHATKKMKEGTREWSVPFFSYYSGRKNGQLQTTANHYAATPLTKNLAEQLTQKLVSSGLDAAVCDLFADPETLIHKNLIDIGEEPLQQNRAARMIQ
jgi:hypothetical protein